jgi:hypothetical protein
MFLPAEDFAGKVMYFSLISFSQSLKAFKKLRLTGNILKTFIVFIAMLLKKKVNYLGPDTLAKLINNEKNKQTLLYELAKLAYT